MSCLDKFGEFIAKARDEAIGFHETMRQGGWRMPAYLPLQEALMEVPPEQQEAIERCVVAAVDDTIDKLFIAVQAAHDRGEGIEIRVNGENVAQVSGKLPDEPHGESGWYARFSKYPPSKG
jgi:hypothetical protein